MTDFFVFLAVCAALFYWIFGGGNDDDDNFGDPYFI
jgi:hypothetical protein